MKVLLTCTSVEDEERTEDAPDSHYPLGIAYLHSYLEEETDYEIESRFLNNVSAEICLTEIKKVMSEFKPDVVGISIMTHSRVSAFKLVEYLSENHPETKVILGGIHPTIMWKQMANKYRDAIVVVGEGEKTLQELLECIENNKPVDGVSGIAYHDGKDVVKTPNRDLIPDLDTLPFPKHDLFLFEGKTVANLLTSRGCPFKCNFCVLDHVSLRKVRYRTPEDVADEIEEILEMCPSVRIIWLHDDAFMINKQYTMDMCDEIIKRGIKTTFTCSARFRPVSRELVKKMELAGFNHVLFGLESGADEVMKGMRKGINKDHIRYATSLFAEGNIKTTAFLIVGLPGESEETIEETIDFVQEMQYNNYLYYDDVGIAGIYPGAELYTMAKSKGLEVPGYGPLDDDYWLTDRKVPHYECDHSHEKLLELKDRLRDGISLTRMFKPAAFLRQRKLLPSIVKYSWKFGITSITQMSLHALQNHSLINEAISAFFVGGQKSEKLLHKICSVIEKQIIETSVIKDMSPEQKTEFIKDYKNQAAEDRRTLDHWRKQRIPATDEYLAPSRIKQKPTDMPTALEKMEN
jgi:radical SAM superfamily enzyme YgiQ (UPF0313 family)